MVDCYDATCGFLDASEGHVIKGRVIAWLVILDFLMGWCCWTELAYLKSYDLPAQFQVVGHVMVGGRHGRRELHAVRYTFRDPHTGKPRQNTVHIPPALVPAGQHVRVQYLPGKFPQSRLALQARPIIPTIFFTAHAILGIALCGFVCLIGKEAHTRQLTRQQRWVRDRQLTHR